MSIRTVVVRLAVAAIVVAGGMGTVWAQGSSLHGVQGVSDVGVMVIGYNNTTDVRGTITVTPISGMTSADTAKFLRFNVWTDTSSANAFELGKVKVKYTGNMNWDVELGSAFGGRLRKDGALTGAPLLKYKSATTNDTVRLGVQLGIYSSSKVYAGAYVDSAWMKTSNTVPIGFSKVFGSRRALASDTTGIRTELGGDRAKVFSGGTPTGQSISDVGFVRPATGDSTITFSVRAGLGLGTTTFIKGSSDGVYADTLKFTLLTSD